MLKRSRCTLTFRGGDHVSLGCCHRKWSDWANLPSDLIEQIACRLLKHDVTEYLRFRAACKGWRQCTDEPRSLESRFRPRRWIMLSNCDGSRRRFLNLATGACAHIDLPELSGHRVESSTEGLLVLRDEGSDAIRLLDPFSRSLTELPPLTEALQNVYPLWIDKWERPGPSRIMGAAISDETSPPSLALFLNGSYLWNIAYAKPGDELWSLVDTKAWRYVPDDRQVLGVRDATALKRVWFLSPVTLRGRIYFATFQGNILELRLRSRPRLVALIKDQTGDFVWHHLVSYLVPPDDYDGGSMLLVRYYNSLDHLRPNEQRNMKRRWKKSNSNLIRLPSKRSGWYDWYLLEVFKVDLRGKRLVPAKSIGRRAVFVGNIACISLSSRIFPSISGNAVYLGANSNRSNPCGVRHLKDGRIEPRLELVVEVGDGKAPAPASLYRCVRGSERVVPRVRPCSLEEYLICYVGIKGGIKD